MKTMKCLFDQKRLKVLRKSFFVYGKHDEKYVVNLNGNESCDTLMCLERLLGISILKIERHYKVNLCKYVNLDKMSIDLLFYFLL